MRAGKRCVNQFILFPAQPFYFRFREMGTNPQCLVRDDAVLIIYQPVDFFSEAFVVLYVMKYLSDILDVYTFG